MDFSDPAFRISVGQIILIDILLGATRDPKLEVQLLDVQIPARRLRSRAGALLRDRV